MPNILLFSEDDAFVTDIKEQIAIYDPEYKVHSEYSSDHIHDLVVIDDVKEVLDSIRKYSFRIPVIYFKTEGMEEPNFIPSDIVLKKPIVLGDFLNYLKSSVYLFDNSSDGYINIGDYELRPAAKEIYNNNTEITVKLTEKEVGILKYLYKSNKVTSKTELLQNLWKYSPDSMTHTIETHIYRLRNKVEESNADSSPIIMTEEGGYRLNSAPIVIDDEDRQDYNLD